MYPQIVLNAAYGQNFGPNDGRHQNSGDWENQEVWQAGLNLKWNIFDFGSKKQLERNLALFEVGGLSQEKLDGSEVDHSTAISAVKDLEQKIRGFKNQLDYLNIRAPFGGIVGTIFLRRGDLATPFLHLIPYPRNSHSALCPAPTRYFAGRKFCWMA